MALGNKILSGGERKRDERKRDEWKGKERLLALGNKILSGRERNRKKNEWKGKEMKGKENATVNLRVGRHFVFQMG